MLKMKSTSILLGVGVIVTRNDHIALGHRRFPQPCWSLPGGKIERLEAIEACACRELYEETGLRGDDKTDILSVANVRIPNLHTITFGVKFTECSGELTLREPDKFSTWEWFPLSRLPDDLFLPTRIVLDCFLNKPISYSSPSTLCRFSEVNFSRTAGGTF